MTDVAVTARELVPTEREIAGGARQPAAPSSHASAGPPAAHRVGLRARIRTLDPREAFAMSRYGARPVVVMSIVSLFVVGLEGSLTALLGPELKASFNYDFKTLGAILGLVYVVGQASAPLIGYLADHWSRVWMLRIGGFVNQAGVLLLIVAGSPWIYAGSVLLQSFGGSLQTPVAFPLLSDYYPPRARARVFSIALGLGSVSWQLSSLLGTIVVLIVTPLLGWRVGLLVFGSLGLAASTLNFLLREPVRGEYDRLALGESAERAAVPQRPLRFIEAARTVFAVRTQRRLWSALPFITGIATAMFLLVPFVLAGPYHLSLTARAAFGLVGALTGIGTALVSGPISDRLLAGRPGLVLVITGSAQLLVVVYGIALALMPPVWIVLALSFIPGFVGGLSGPALAAVMAAVIPARVRGFSFQIGAIVGAVGAGILISLLFLVATVGFQVAFLLFGGVGIIGAIITMSAASCVAQDIRAAEAANAASDEARRSREGGRGKLLVCRDVDVTYDGVQVLFGVDFDVADGECVALLGTNGAGKSTLLRAIAGIEQASNGAIIFDGDDITHAPAHDNAERGIVMIPGGRAVFPSLSVRDNLRAATWLHRGDADACRDRIARVHEWFPVLDDRADQLAGSLSGGEQQMLSLAQAFIMTPRLLLIDELSLGLAPQVIEKLLGIVKDIRATGTTVVIVEQSVNLALTVAERAVFMEKGQIRFDGPVPDLLARPDILRSVFLGEARGAARLGSRAGAAARRHGEQEETLLELRDVDVAFGGVHALHGIGLTMSPGEIVGVIGPNGAGKSTLSDVISGFVSPPQLCSGSVVFMEHDITGLSPDARARLGIARSFQNVRLFPQMTVRENIAVALEKRLKVRSAVLSALWAPPVLADEARVRRRTDNLVEALGLGAFENKFVAELSTGSRRIVDIACQLAGAPRLLLLDEPSSGLAQAEAEEMPALIARINRETGCAVLLVEHDVRLITAVAQRLIALDLGEIIAAGDPADVLADSRVVNAYLSTTPDVMVRSGTRVWWGDNKGGPQ